MRSGNQRAVHVPLIRILSRAAHRLCSAYVTQDTVGQTGALAKHALQASTRSRVVVNHARCAFQAHSHVTKLPIRLVFVLRAAWALFLQQAVYLF